MTGFEKQDIQDYTPEAALKSTDATTGTVDYDEAKFNAEKADLGIIGGTVTRLKEAMTAAGLTDTTKVGDLATELTEITALIEGITDGTDTNLITTEEFTNAETIITRLSGLPDTIKEVELESNKALLDDFVTDVTSDAKYGTTLDTPGGYMKLIYDAMVTPPVSGGVAPLENVKAILEANPTMKTALATGVLANRELALAVYAAEKPRISNIAQFDEFEDKYTKGLDTNQALDLATLASGPFTASLEQMKKVGESLAQAATRKTQLEAFNANGSTASTEVKAMATTLLGELAGQTTEMTANFDNVLYRDDYFVAQIAILNETTQNAQAGVAFRFNRLTNLVHRYTQLDVALPTNYDFNDITTDANEADYIGSGFVLHADSSLINYISKTEPFKALVAGLSLAGSADVTAQAAFLDTVIARVEPALETQLTEMDEAIALQSQEPYRSYLVEAGTDVRGLELYHAGGAISRFRTTQAIQAEHFTGEDVDGVFGRDTLAYFRAESNAAGSQGRAEALGDDIQEVVREIDENNYQDLLTFMTNSGGAVRIAGLPDNINRLTLDQIDSVITWMEDPANAEALENGETGLSLAQLQDLQKGFMDAGRAEADRWVSPRGGAISAERTGGSGGTVEVLEAGESVESGRYVVDTARLRVRFDDGSLIRTLSQGDEVILVGSTKFMKIDGVRTQMARTIDDLYVAFRHLAPPSAEADTDVEAEVDVDAETEQDDTADRPLVRPETERASLDEVIADIRSEAAERNGGRLTIGGVSAENYEESHDNMLSSSIESLLEDEGLSRKQKQVLRRADRRLNGSFNRFEEARRILNTVNAALLPPDTD
jgi:hypothetical protein